MLTEPSPTHWLSASTVLSDGHNSLSLSTNHLLAPPPSLLLLLLLLSMSPAHNLNFIPKKADMTLLYCQMAHQMSTCTH